AVDVEFHTAIGECAHNIILLHTLRSCYRLLADGVFHNRLMIFSLPDAREPLLAQPTAISDAGVRGARRCLRRTRPSTMRWLRAMRTRHARLRSSTSILSSGRWRKRTGPTTGGG